MTTFNLRIDMSHKYGTREVQEILAQTALNLAREDSEHDVGDVGAIYFNSERAGEWSVTA